MSIKALPVVQLVEMACLLRRHPCMTMHQPEECVGRRVVYCNLREYCEWYLAGTIIYHEYNTLTRLHVDAGVSVVPR